MKRLAQKLCFPHLTMKALVRGGEVLNDATMEDAVCVGLNNVAEIISNGDAIAGTVYDIRVDGISAGRCLPLWSTDRNSYLAGHIHE